MLNLRQSFQSTTNTLRQEIRMNNRSLNLGYAGFKTIFKQSDNSMQLSAPEDSPLNATSIFPQSLNHNTLPNLTNQANNTENETILLGQQFSIPSDKIGTNNSSKLSNPKNIAKLAFQT